MKLIWLCNLAIPDISKKLNISISNGGGWLTGLAESLKKEQNIKLTIIFPMYNVSEILEGSIDNIRFYGFPKKIKDPTKYEKDIEDHFKNILEKENPDIVHIFGTEFPHTLSMVRAFNNPEKTIINIQGLCHIIAKHYLNGIDFKYHNKYTIRDFIKQDNLKQQQKKFLKRGVFEVEALKNVSHAIGRTTWDKTCVEQINNSINYYHCNETLRKSFYKEYWDIDKCEKYSIFLSQANYPVKGLHFMLDAFSKVIERFPKARLYIAGDDVYTINKFRENYYSKLIKKVIEEKNLKNNIKFLGSLSEVEIKDRFLKTHVYALPSVIENSPNSLCEAMLIGVPCVASYVGGVSDLIVDKKEGLLYQVDAPYMLAKYICNIFDDEILAKSISINARKHAKKTHDIEENLNTIINIYKSL